MEEFEMNSKARKCFNELQKAGCPVKEWYTDERGHFWIDAEEPEAEEWLDYWRTSLCAGSDRLNRILKKHGLYFEWQNSAYAHVYDI
jgi:hypothetical protein